MLSPLSLLVSWQGLRPALPLAGGSCPLTPCLRAKPCTWTQRCRGAGGWDAWACWRDLTEPGNTLPNNTAYWNSCGSKQPSQFQALAQSLTFTCPLCAPQSSSMPQSPYGPWFQRVVWVHVERQGSSMTEWTGDHSSRATPAETWENQVVPALPAQSPDSVSGYLFTSLWLSLQIPLPSALRFLPITAQVAMVFRAM